MRRLLVLRPEPGASATLERALGLGLDALVVPLFALEPRAWDAPDPRRFDGLLLTSANAVRLGGEKLEMFRTLPVYAVGEATAQAAREAGFDVKATGNEGVDGLLGSILPELRLLHLSGEDRRSPVDPRRKITSVPVYRATALDAPDLSVAEGTVVLVHSPRAARRLAKLVSKRRSIRVAAISPAAAQAAGSGWAQVEYACEPNDDALLALAARLCNIPPQE